MAITEIIFKGSGSTKYNDDFQKAAIFLSVRKYRITIIPRKGHFFRFGLRFSSVRDIHFAREGDRHFNPNTPDLHWAVGEYNDSEWTLPERLQLVQYHFPNREHVLKRFENYAGGHIQAEIIFAQLDADFNVIIINFQSGSIRATERIDISKKYRYFTPFAWADNSEYEILCKIDRSDEDVLQDRREYPPEFQDMDRNYWLLKLNAANFDGAIYRRGAKIHFGTHTTTMQERPEYDLYHRVKQDDRVLGFAMFPTSAVVNVMRVVKPVFSETTLGEVIELVVDEVFQPSIMLDDFWEILTAEQREALSARSKVRLLESSHNEFAVIRHAQTRGRRPRYRTSVHPEGAHSETPDQLDFDSDVEALSTLIALKSMNPPLAIGLFANWGAGKSFFMEKLHEQMVRLGKSGEAAFVTNIVQVRFNAWHYHDSNLWASLISEVFDSLSAHANGEHRGESMRAIINSLEITRLERVATTEEKLALERQVAQYEDKRAMERAELKNISGIKLLTTVLTDELISSQFSELKNDNIEDIVQNKEKVEGYIKTLSSSGVLVKGFFKQVANLKGRSWLVVFFLTVLVYIAIIGTKYVFHVQWEHLTAKAALIYATLTTFIGGFIRVLAPYITVLNKSKRQLDSLIKSFEAVPGELDDGNEKDKARLKRLTDSITVLDQKIAVAEEKVSSIVSGNQLRSFISHKIKDGNYNSNLGLISIIRKDFEKLDQLLRLQKEALEKGQGDDQQGEQTVGLRIERIVLYIDDLDRCNEDIVLKVLEAIHLLLAFPLFVVVVGVDPRWLDKSINLKLGSLLGQAGESGQQEESDFVSRATSFDYLEKIFQIPFSIRPLTNDSREKLLDYLLNLNMRDEPINVSRAAQADPGGDFVVLPEGPSLSPVASITLQNNIRTDIPPAIRALYFEAEEIVFIKRISFIFGRSPRTINRFVNLYRIVRCHREFIAGDVFGRDHQAALLVLAILVGKAAEVRGFVKALSGESDESKSLGAFLSSNPSLKWFAILLGHGGIHAELDELNISNFRKNLSLLCRFSFRTMME